MERAERDDATTRPQRERSAGTHQRLWACRAAGHSGDVHPSKQALGGAFAARFGGEVPARCPFEGVFLDDPLIRRVGEAQELLEAGASERTAWKGRPSAVDRDALLVTLRFRNRCMALEMKRESEGGDE